MNKFVGLSIEYLLLDLYLDFAIVTDSCNCCCCDRLGRMLYYFLASRLKVPLGLIVGDISIALGSERERIHPTKVGVLQRGLLHIAQQY